MPDHVEHQDLVLISCAYYFDLRLQELWRRVTKKYWWLPNRSRWMWEHVQIGKIPVTGKYQMA